jgi:transposase
VFTTKLSPKQRGCRPRIFNRNEEIELVLLIRDNPSITLEEIKVRFNKNCNTSIVHRTLLRLGITYKKTLRASEQDREDIKKAREDWAEWSAACEIGSLVFIDESSAKINMRPLHERSLPKS